MLAHAAVLAALLLRPPQERVADTEPSYELVFSGGGTPDRSTSEQPGPEQPPSAPVPDTAPEQPALLEPPAPPDAPMLELPPAEPLPPAPPAPDTPAPEPPAPELAPSAPLQPEPTPPQPEPAPALPDPVPVPDAPRPPATVRLAEPEPLAPTLTPQSLVPDLALAVPPMPPLQPPAPQRQAPPRPAPDRRFASPLDLNFNQALNRAAPAPRGSVASRAIDLSLGAPKPGPNKSEAFFDARAAKVGADWANGLAAYWRRHRFYPRQAAENGEDGTVQVELVVNRLGKVESVEISRRSGSPWLDMAALSTWRGAQLAPFPAENTEPRVTMTLTINYILLR